MITVTLNIKKFLIAICCIFLVSGNHLWAQFSLEEYRPICSVPKFEKQYQIINDVDYNFNYITVDAAFNYAANSIEKSFVQKIYNSNFLDTDAKTHALNKLNSQNNLAGGWFDINAKANFKSKFKNLSYYIGFSNHNYADLKFDKDLFKIIFFGNADMEGQHAEMNQQGFQLLKFQQLKFGITKSWLSQIQIQGISAGLAINNGQQLLSFQSSGADFFTHPNAEQLDLQLKLSMNRSDTLRSSFGTENGLGISGDFYYFFRDCKNFFSVSVNDFGFIKWNKFSQQYSKDTLISFEGIEIKNIFNLNGENVQTISGDSLNNEFVYARNQNSFLKMIPSKVAINYVRFFLKNKISLSAEISKYLFLSSAITYIFAPAYHVQFKKSDLHLSVIASYGGYSKFDLGGAISANFNSKFFFEIKSEHLYSLLSKTHQLGAGIQVALIKSF